MLVNINCSLEVPSKIFIGLKSAGYDFLVNIVYEKLPAYCYKCEVVGHAAQECRKEVYVSRREIDSHLCYRQWQPVRPNMAILAGGYDNLNYAVNRLKENIQNGAERKLVLKENCNNHDKQEVNEDKEATSVKHISPENGTTEMGTCDDREQFDDEATRGNTTTEVSSSIKAPDEQKLIEGGMTRWITLTH